MKKKHVALIVIIIFISSMAALGEMFVTIKKTGTKRGAVTFNHRRHKLPAMELQKCRTCHHVGNYSQSCSDAGCHNDRVKDAEGKRIHVTCIQKCHKPNVARTPTLCSDKRCHKS